MKKTARTIAALALAAGLTLLTGCSGGAPKNQVFAAADLPGREIGIMAQTTSFYYRSDFEDQGIIVKTYSDSDAMMDDVTSGVLDCAVIDGAVTEQSLTGHGRLKALEEPAAEEAYSIVTALESKSMMNLLDGALSQLMAEGTVQSILDSYIQGTDYKYEPPEIDYYYEDTEDMERKNTLTLAVNYIGRPFAFKDEAGQPAGIDIDIARAVCDKIAAELVIRDAQGEDLIYMVRSGKADFTLGRLVATEENQELASFSQPYYTCRQVIIVRKK